MARYVRVPENKLLRLGPTILQLKLDERIWKAHPNDKAISIFKPVNYTLTVGIYIYRISKSEAMASH